MEPSHRTFLDSLEKILSGPKSKSEKLPHQMDEVNDQTPVEGAVLLTVTYVKDGKLYEYNAAMPYKKSAFGAPTLSDIGTVLQQYVYDGLRIAMIDATKAEEEKTNE